RDAEQHCDRVVGVAEYLVEGASRVDRYEPVEERGKHRRHEEDDEPPLVLGQVGHQPSERGAMIVFAWERGGELRTCAFGSDRCRHGPVARGHDSAPGWLCVWRCGYEVPGDDGLTSTATHSISHLVGQMVSLLAVRSPLSSTSTTPPWEAWSRPRRRRI